MKPVKDIQTRAGSSADEIVRGMHEAGGFVAKKIGVGLDILEKMNKEECTRFFSFPSCVVSTGNRGVVRDLVKDKLVDVLITTCGTLDHDLARIWTDYYHGYFEADDAKLRDEGINREGNIFIPNESYGVILEDKLQPMFKEIFAEKNEICTRDLVWEIGEKIKDEEKVEESIVYWCWKNKIPMFIPGPTDGAFGSHLWMHYQTNRDLRLDLLKDEQELSNIVHDAKKTGAFIIGGGISKHHTIWWNQFRGGLDYAVFITTAPEWDGSLSGAKMREAVSWGKIKKDAPYVTIEADATTILPLMITALKERL